ncbi:hypothetical protein C1645_833615 [Glomus cerebriforme]|uniref:Uncharacterized protein n=1 Tax=Glomus cerebriforme TaxID=658196 RepID=A0A397SFE1_9GLOM|nr:hypothetical protein C1645_833615 [Glomus cerebriforme]
MLEAKITEFKAKDPDRMIKISEVMPVENTKLRKKFIKQIEKNKLSVFDAEVAELKHRNQLTHID